ncbi:MAG: rod shape-determining protein [Clostridia bacterium]|nr:rod shape-determining protein [Clostridia bacterium]
MVTKIGLDLGYANITVSDTMAGIYREQSVALIDRDSRRIISVGKAAIEQGDELSDRAMLVRPFKNGLLFDRQITQSIVSYVVGEIPKGERLRCVIGIPSDLIQKQEREVFNILNDSGIAECYAVNRAVAALIGAGGSPLDSVISVNVGASATEIVVLHNGLVTFTSRSPIGGEDFDKAVKQYIGEQGGVNVSLSVARAIKEQLGSVWHGKEESCVDIEGTLSLTGNSVKMSISSEDIVGVFEKPLHSLLMAVANAIKKIPLDQVEKIFAGGIVLTGGGSMIHGLDLMMSKVLGISVRQPSDPIDSVAKGLSIINSKIPVMGNAGRKNVTDVIATYYKDIK